MGSIEERDVPQLQAILQQIDVLVLLGVRAGINHRQDEVMELCRLRTIALWEQNSLYEQFQNLCHVSYAVYAKTVDENSLQNYSNKIEIICIKKYLYNTHEIALQSSWNCSVPTRE